jgi:hypothetical protein
MSDSYCGYPFDPPFLATVNNPHLILKVIVQKWEKVHEPPLAQIKTIEMKRYTIELIKRILFGSSAMMFLGIEYHNTYSDN